MGHPTNSWFNTTFHMSVGRGSPNVRLLFLPEGLCPGREVGSSALLAVLFSNIRIGSVAR